MKEQNILEDLLKKKGGKKQKEEPKKKRKKSSSHIYPNKKAVKSKSFEIMLKIAGGSASGHGHNKEQLKACLHYIIKGSETKTIETSLGEEVTHKDVLEKLEKYCFGFKQSPSSALRKNRLFTHAIISLPNNVNEYSKYQSYNDKELQFVFKQSLKETMQELFPYNDYLLAMHDNGNNLHAHIPILCKGFDGRKIRINKKELQEIRKTLVNKLQEKGLSLKATSFLDQERERQETIQNKDNTQKQKLKRIHLEQGFKVGSAYKTKAPSWVRNKDNLLVLNAYKIDLRKCKNKKQENKILELEERFNSIFKDSNLALKSFLMLYKENKSLATWSLFNNTKIFAELKDEFKQDKKVNELNQETTNYTYSSVNTDINNTPYQNQKLDKNRNANCKQALQQQLENLRLRDIESGVLVNDCKGIENSKTSSL